MVPTMECILKIYQDDAFEIYLPYQGCHLILGTCNTTYIHFILNLSFPNKEGIAFTEKIIHFCFNEYQT